MERYQIISIRDNKILNESDSYSFILYVSNRFKKMETPFKIVDTYSGTTKEIFEPVFL